MQDKPGCGYGVIECPRIGASIWFATRSFSEYTDDRFAVSFLKLDKTILVGRHTKRYSFQTLVHELAHLRTGRAARPRTHLELRVQSRCAAAVRQRASNGHIILRLRSTPQRLCQREDLSRECHAVRSCSRSRSRKQPSSRQCKRSGREVAKHGFDCAGNPVGR